MEVSPSGYGSGASARKQPIALWPGVPDSPATAVLSEIRSRIYERIPDASAAPQVQLLTKTPSQSRAYVLYNFSTDSALRESYRNPWNELAFGKLIEDLDALALTISIKHCSDDDSTTRPLLLLTASVDKLELKKPLSVRADLHISGAVTFVGHSSIEIQLDVTQPGTDIAEATDSALTANFIFVARDYRTGKAVPVNPINPESEREKLLHEVAESRYILRKSNVMQNGVKRFEPPLTARHRRQYSSDSESEDDADPPLPVTSIYLKDTCLQNNLIFPPQQRNIHGRIYGGFLMHKAFELALSTAYAFSGMTPSFLNVDRVDFPSPVNLGDFLQLKSLVLYTENDDSYQPSVHVEVSAQVTRPDCCIVDTSSEVSNMFYFKFALRRDPNAMEGRQMIRKIALQTRQEARRVIRRMDANDFQQ